MCSYGHFGGIGLNIVAVASIFTGQLIYLCGYLISIIGMMQVQNIPG